MSHSVICPCCGHVVLVDVILKYNVGKEEIEEAVVPVVELQDHDARRVAKAILNM
jgi:hypothetical protein